jgi:4-amino-4-deoxy-L-arabinose transferase-like glycosyltransferase
MTTQRQSHCELRWDTIEKVLFMLAILSRVIFCLTHIGVAVGYDVDGHLQAMSAVQWLHPFFSLRSFYYATHPALGFLLANTIQAILQTSPLVSAQVVSLLASLVILLSLRFTLRVLGLLHRPVAIAFLYIAYGMPLQVYMATAVNLDIIVFAFSCLALLASVTLLRSGTSSPFSLPVFLTGLFLAAACLTKVTGFVAFAIPLLVFLLLGKWSVLRLKQYFLIAGTAVALILPYYWINYYIPEKTFFFCNAGTTFMIEDTQEAIANRNKDQLGFFRSLVLPFGSHIEGRLFRTWAGLWRMEDRDAQSTMATRWIALYLAAAPWLALLGAFLFLKPLWSRQETRFGALLLSYTYLLIAFTIALLYRYPLEGYDFNKVIYVAPVSLGICYLIAASIGLPRLLWSERHRFTQAYQCLFIAGVAVFLVINSIGAVY